MIFWKLAHSLKTLDRRTVIICEYSIRVLHTVQIVIYLCLVPCAAASLFQFDGVAVINQSVQPTSDDCVLALFPAKRANLSTPGMPRPSATLVPSNHRSRHIPGPLDSSIKVLTTSDPPSAILNFALVKLSAATTPQGPDDEDANAGSRRRPNRADFCHF